MELYFPILAFLLSQQVKLNFGSAEDKKAIRYPWLIGLGFVRREVNIQ